VRISKYSGEFKAYCFLAKIGAPDLENNNGHSTARVKFVFSNVKGTFKSLFTNEFWKKGTVDRWIYYNAKPSNKKGQNLETLLRTFFKTGKESNLDLKIKNPVKTESKGVKKWFKRICIVTGVNQMYKKLKNSRWCPGGWVNLKKCPEFDQFRSLYQFSWKQEVVAN